MSVTTSGIEAVTFRLVVQCYDQLRIFRVPLHPSVVKQLVGKFRLCLNYMEIFSRSDYYLYIPFPPLMKYNLYNDF
jgi:hypothetical protein